MAGESARIARIRAQILRGGGLAVWRETSAAIAADPQKPWIVVSGAEVLHNVPAVVLPQGGALNPGLGFLKGTDFVQGKAYALVGIPAVNASTFAPTNSGRLTLADGTELRPYSVTAFKPAGIALVYVVELSE